MSLLHRFFITFLALSSAWTSALAESSTCDGLRIWKRKPGNYTDGADIPRMHEETLRWNAIAANAKVRKIFDVQYQKEESYKVVRLVDILDLYKATKSGSDLLLLHFQNGMIIPLSLDDTAAFQDKVYVSTAIKVEKSWTSDFPTVSRDDPYLRDPRPIRFCGNKMVVTKPLSFRLAEQNKTLSLFTPWRHADSLTGLELADRKAYYDQFDIGKSAQANLGFQVFKNRCQFCHGVQRIGAELGWDYAGPIPAFEKRQPDSLFLHVKYEKVEQFRLGTIMPSQPDMQREEANQLWQWLRDVAKNKTKPYSP